ncbi:hypothetical protein U5801_24555 [Lamprobacter modestohalophilus]|uniref:hypothetical protein n=1 Tax=Lamprobacter modestohalophilus TaxID=1064514 RepID=UPI002ADEC489|nr:hypothetical protein [Lamprobacter modestohalophilus]MEA1052955.1 hypothetical protein [Lamprobacter modestohalophilus]
MLTNLHRSAALLAFLFIATFMVSTLIAELFLSHASVAEVKQAIVSALFVLVPLLMMTGGSGFALARGRVAALINAKRRRMPLIALNGLLVLVPLAVFLNLKAAQGEFDSIFYGAQGIELIAGALNLWLIGLNARDGLRQRTWSSAAAVTSD